MEGFASVWLPSALQLVSGPAALKALRSCRSLKKLQPRCLQAGEGLWILEQLQTIPLEKLLEKDEDLCRCFMWARDDMTKSKICYGCFSPSFEIHTSAPEPESRTGGDDDEDDYMDFPPKLAVRSLSESFLAMDGYESLELTKRVLGLPKHMSDRLPRLFEGSLKVVGKESPALIAMGLEGWEVSENYETTEIDSNWKHFCFHHPTPKIPLAIFRLSGDFDLAGGDGSGKVNLGYVSTDLDYVVASRTLREYPIYRWLTTKVLASWKEAEDSLKIGCEARPRVELEGTEMSKIFAKITTDGWEVEVTSTYTCDHHCIAGSPHLQAVYRDAKRLKAALSDSC